MSAAPAFEGAPGSRFLAEPTAVGEQSCERSLSGGQEGAQLLVPGVAPISLRERLAMRAAAPLEPKKPQRPPDIGLFDLAARNQLDLFGPGGRVIDPELPPRGG
jgi:hypothetical protein